MTLLIWLVTVFPSRTKWFQMKCVESFKCIYIYGFRQIEKAFKTHQSNPLIPHYKCMVLLSNNLTFFHKGCVWFGKYYYREANRSVDFLAGLDHQGNYYPIILDTIPVILRRMLGACPSLQWLRCNFFIFFSLYPTKNKYY